MKSRARIVAWLVALTFVLLVAPPFAQPARAASVPTTEQVEARLDRLETRLDQAIGSPSEKAMDALQRVVSVVTGVGALVALLTGGLVFFAGRRTQAATDAVMEAKGQIADSGRVWTEQALAFMQTAQDVVGRFQAQSQAAVASAESQVAHAREAMLAVERRLDDTESTFAAMKDLEEQVRTLTSEAAADASRAREDRAEAEARSQDALNRLQQAGVSGPSADEVQLRASLAADRGDVDKAVQLLFEVLEHPTATGIDLNNAAIVAGRVGADELKFKLLERGYREHPEHRRIPGSYAKALYVTGRRDEAIALFEQLLVDRPEDDWVAAMYADVLNDSAKHERACDMLSSAAERMPRSSLCARNLARALSMAGRTSEAEEWFVTALELDPSDDIAPAFAANHYSRKKDYEKSLSMIDEAIRRDPNDSNYRFIRADTLDDAQRYDEARVAFEEALKRWPKYTSGRKRYARFLAKQGDSQLAEAVMDGEYPPAHKGVDADIQVSSQE